MRGGTDARVEEGAGRAEESVQLVWREFFGICRSCPKKRMGEGARMLISSAALCQARQAQVGRRGDAQGCQRRTGVICPARNRERWQSDRKIRPTRYHKHRSTTSIDPSSNRVVKVDLDCLLNQFMHSSVSLDVRGERGQVWHYTRTVDLWVTQARPSVHALQNHTRPLPSHSSGICLHAIDAAACRLVVATVYEDERCRPPPRPVPGQDF